MGGGGGGGGGRRLVAYVSTSRGGVVDGGVLPNSDPFGQTEKGGDRGCKNWTFSMDVKNVWSLKHQSGL